MRLQEFFTNEGIHDPYIFKAIFFAGGPGSGKSYVANKLLSGTGLKTVNPDKALEFLMDKNNINKNMSDIGDQEYEYIQNLRIKSKNLTSNQQALYIAGRLGLIIDGTAKDVTKIENIKNELEKIGYETCMVFVNTELEISIQRNKDRFKRGGRKVPEDFLKTAWQNVQNNMMKFQQLFKPSYFYIIDNSNNLEYLNNNKNFDFIWKNIRKFLEDTPKNKTATQWMTDEMTRNRRFNIKK